MGKDQAPKMSIFGQENALLGEGELDDAGVVSARAELCYSQHVVPGCTQSADDSEVATLIGEEPHAPPR